MQYLRELTAWLTDYYAATTVVLLLAGAVRVCLRQPIQRMVLARATLVSVALLLGLCAVPFWPRMTLWSRSESRRVSAEPFVPAINESRLSKLAENHSTVRVAIPLPIEKPNLRPTAILSERPELVFSPSEVTRSNSVQLPPTDVWLPLGFLAGALSVLSWEVAGLIQVRSLRASGRPALEFALHELQSLVSAGSVVPQLLVSPRVTSAVALGLWRPAIVLPVQAVESSERIRLRALLAHEWAHLHRGDLRMLALARLLLPVLYAHPLYWWLRRQIRMDQEFLADATAAEECGHQAYAESLVSWARLLPPTPSRMTGVIGIWESPKLLTRRIAMLLDERNHVHTQSTRYWDWGAALTALALVAGLSLVTLRPGRAADAAEPKAAQGTPDAALDTVAAVPELTRKPASLSKGRGILDVSGVCLDEQKRPVVDARLVLVFVNHDDGSQDELQELRSDAEGKFRFTQINTGKLFATSWTSLQRLFQPPVRKLMVIAQAPGRATIERSMWTQQSGSQSFELILRPAASLKGRIVDEQGRPIVGATVSANGSTMRSLQGVLSAVTDADGRYEIGDLAPWDKKAADLARRKGEQVPSEIDLRNLHVQGHGLIQHPDFANRGFEFSAVPSTHDFKLPHPATVAGQITFEESGKPAAKVALELVRDSSKDGSYGRETVVTDGEGRYSISKKLLPGNYEITGRLVGWPSKVTHAVPLKSGQNAVDLKLETGGTIQLKVIEVGTGKPLEMSPGELTLIQAGHVATKAGEYVSLNPDGTCSITVLPGKTMLAVSSIRLQPTPGGATDQRSRWILVDNDRRAFQLVDVAKGETKQVELRLLRTAVWDGDGMNFIEDDDEYREQLNQLLDPGASTTPSAGQPSGNTLGNISEQAAVAAIKQLGGGVQTGMIDGVECVTEVNMAYAKVDGKSVENKVFTDEALFYLRKLPRLKSLMLTRGQISDQGLTFLRGMENIEFVCLMDAWGLTDIGISHVTTLPKLTRFCCNNAEQLTDDSLRHFGQAANLQHLSLDGGRVSDAGLKHLHNLKHLTTLEINSSESLITDKGLQELAGHHDLETLELEHTLITDAGLKHLYGLAKLTQLTLKRSMVTPEGLAELRKLLPKLKLPDEQKGPHAEHGAGDQ
jgi:beta-lactamase regulating signal transducer with metallopeptidase domain